MKSALLFAASALGLLTIPNLRKSGTRRRRIEAALGELHRPRARRMRLRHRNAEGLLRLKFGYIRRTDGADRDLMNGSAERILENRPYLTKLDLIGRRVIPDARYAAIKQFVTVVHGA